jgi:hypothetical protein
MDKLDRFYQDIQVAFDERFIDRIETKCNDNFIELSIIPHSHNKTILERIVEYIHSKYEYGAAIRDNKVIIILCNKKNLTPFHNVIHLKNEQCN